MDRTAKVYVAGHRGMVGSALVRALQAAGHGQVVVRTSAELDLREGWAKRFRDIKTRHKTPKAG